MKTPKTSKYLQLCQEIGVLTNQIYYAEAKYQHIKVDKLKAKREKLQDKCDTLSESMTVDEQRFLGIHDN